MHKKILVLLALLSIIFVLFSMPVIVYGESHCEGIGSSDDCEEGVGPGSDGASIKNPIGANSLRMLISDILDVVVRIGTPIAVFFIIYSGFLFVKARGNPEELDTAKKAFAGAIIGTAILLGAFAISQIIENTVDQIKSGGGNVESEVYFPLNIKDEQNV